MTINPVSLPPLTAMMPATSALKGDAGAGAWEDFSVTLARQIQESDRMQKEAKELSQKALLGNAGVTIHEAQIAGAEAELNLRLLMQVRNKALEVYREIMSMPA